MVERYQRSAVSRNIFSQGHAVSISERLCITVYLCLHLVFKVGVSDIEGFENMCKVVDIALEVGYRSFDSSPRRSVEEDLGCALEVLLPKYNLTRRDITITSKIHPKDYGMDTTSEAFWSATERLKTSYIDLYLMQWPGGNNLGPEAEESRYLREDTWKELVKLSSEGVIKSPGVCNFTCAHLESIRDCCSEIPVVNQVEFHPRFPQVELLEYCKTYGILVQACSFKDTFHPLLLRDETVREVGKTVKKTPTQVILKWIINKNVGVITQSESAETIKQNFNLFNFTLEKPEMDKINAIQAREKYLRNPITVI